MKYPAYREAALRHLKACQQMLAHAATLADGQEKTAVVLDTYYLSMYIVECSVKWAIFKHSKHKDTVPISKLEFMDDASIYTYEEYIKTHEFNTYVKALKATGFDVVNIPEIELKFSKRNYDDKTKHLFSQWKVDLRYEVHIQLPPAYSEIESLVKACEAIYTGLISPPTTSTS